MEAQFRGWFLRRRNISDRMLQFCVFFLAFSQAAFSQVSTGTITGRVTDATGALLPQSAVVLTKPATGLVVRTTSNTDGTYSFGSLQTGDYEVEASHDGFKKGQAQTTLTVGQTAQVDLSLPVGNTSETVTVQSDETMQLYTNNATISYVVGAQQVADLPMNGRNAYGLAALAPGIAPGGSFGVGLSTTRGALVAAGNNNFEANGGVAGSNEIMLDGVPITICCQGQPAVTPTTEVIDQFSVITSVPPAQFGRTSGGILNLVTKTGTNRIRGDVYEYFRNDQLDAANYFQKRTNTLPIPGRNDFRAPHRFNEFGGFISGPVYIPKLYHGRDKTFFSFGYEGTRNVLSGFVTTTVPTLLMRQGIFTEALNPIYDPHNLNTSGATPVRGLLPAGCNSAGCFAAGRVVPTIDPVAQKLINLYPLPNAPNVAPYTNNYSYSQGAYTVDDQYNFRIDHNFTPNERMFVRGTRDTDTYVVNDLFNQPTGPNAFNQAIKAYLFALGDTWVASPSLLFQVSYGFAYQTNLGVPQNFTGYKASDYGFSSNFASEQQVPGLPLITVGGLTNLGEAANLNAFDHYNHILTASTTWQKGSHALAFGYDGRIILENEQVLNNPLGSIGFDSSLTNGPNPNTAITAAAAATGQAQSDAFAAFLLGTPTTASITRQQTVAFKQWYNAMYLQDDWRVRSNLTVNIGLRYEIETGPHERYNRWADISTSIANPLSSPAFPVQGGAQYLGASGNPSNAWKTYHDKFSPRVGFSFTATPTTVVRGGFGVLFLPTSERVYSAGTVGYSQATANNYTKVQVPTTTTSNPIPNGVSLPLGSSLGVQAGNGTSVQGLRYDNPMAYNEQWNFGVEQQLAQGVVLQLNYVGSHSVKLPIGTRLNDLPPQYWGDPNNPAPQTKYLQTQVPNPFFGKSTAGPLATVATVPQSQLLVAYPQFGMYNSGLINSTFNIQQNDIGSVSYNGMQVSVNFNRKNSLTGTVNYTWSKVLGNAIDITTAAFNATGSPAVQSFYFLKDERTNLASDIPHRIVGSANYNLPFGRTQRFGSKVSTWINEIIGDWKLNGIVTVQSGYPATPTQSGGASFSGSRPTMVPGISPQTKGSIKQRLGPVGQYGQTQTYFNPAAFTLTLPFQLGNVPRSSAAMRGPINFQDDVSAIKNFPIHSTTSLQFRLEAFNVLNKVQFALPNASVNSAGFGQITSQSNNPRNVQLALKLFF